VNVLAICRALCRGPKGTINVCRWLRCPDYHLGDLVPVELPNLRAWGASQSTPAPGEQARLDLDGPVREVFQVLGVTIRVKTPVGWGCSLGERSPFTDNLAVGGPLLRKSGDLIVCFAPLSGWFEVLS
jgi:hypothetical protein